jgi:hypothetical protein
LNDGTLPLKYDGYHLTGETPCPIDGGNKSIGWGLLFDQVTIETVYWPTYVIYEASNLKYYSQLLPY